MKRKRGNMKGKGKKPKLTTTNEVASNVVSLNTEDNSAPDELDNEEVHSRMDAETEPTPPPPRTSQPEKLPDADSVGRPINNMSPKAIVYTRVKVKIKTSKNFGTQHTASEAPTQSDTDKSVQQVGLEKQGDLNEKMEDSANSLSETNGVVSGNTSKKSLGIKIKSSRGLGSSSMSPSCNSEPVKRDGTEKKDAESIHKESIYNEQELKAALEVVRRIMKMDAAEPFNKPVNPVALGIPDYFDVIDTPMDFGTICSNLEKGAKYKNSEDVFRDVQYIWENCYKYNNKGGYVVELMKRVKKNFTKYWTALGLFDDQPQETNGDESNPINDLTPSSEGYTPVNGGALTLSSKKFHGLKKHKDVCQCAICVMMRRRQEREEIARMMGGHAEGSDDSLGEDIKQEGNSHGESPFGEYDPSNMENSPDSDADVERKGHMMKLGNIRHFYEDGNRGVGKREGSQDSQLGHRTGDENVLHIEGGSISNGLQEEMPKQNEDGSTVIDQLNPKEKLDKNQRAKMLENLRYLENPMLLELYGTLFADKSRSLWNGPHSLVRHHYHNGSTHRSSFHSAISSFMK